MKHCIAAILCFAGFSTLAQPSGEEKWGVVLSHPEMKNVTVKTDIQYQPGTTKSTLDIYLPPGIKEKRPAVIFFPEASKGKSAEIYKTWARLIAAHGLIGIAVDIDRATYKESAERIIDFVAREGAKHQIDTQNIGIFSASHVPEDAAASLVKDNLNAGIKAVVLYYRNPTLQGPFRKDLPVLFITDDQIYFSPERWTPLWNEVQKSKAPWTMTFGAGMPYFFDAYTDNDQARKLVRETVYFFKNHLEPLPPTSGEPAPDREMIATLYSGDLSKASDLFKNWVEKNPEDQYALTKYGMISMILKNYTEAEAAYSKVTNLDPVEMVDYSRVLFALNKTKEALAVSEKAAEIKSNSYILFNLACAYAHVGETNKAFAAIEQAIEKGFNSRQRFESNADMQLLKSDARFQTVLQKLK